VADEHDRAPALIRDRQASVREVVEKHQWRIDTVNPALNAVVIRLDEQALAAADARLVVPGGLCSDGYGSVTWWPMCAAAV
jgi:Asp-tRNA(Asn)/Glu-tRNA(Gln) amidotransferase A subunit family amidase